MSSKRKASRPKTKRVPISTKVHEQKHSDCWAYATATAIRAAQEKKGVAPAPHYVLYSNIVKEFPEVWVKKGGDVRRVFGKFCPMLGLKYRVPSSALSALKRGNVVAATFFLADNQWDNFQSYFDENPGGKLRKKHLGAPEVRASGHAVVICGYNTDERGDYYYVKNSWGEEDADGGYFRVYADVLEAQGLELTELY